MHDKLDIIVVKLCEKLPFDITLFEEEGQCTKQSDRCRYLRKEGECLYNCYKKTYIPNMTLKFI
jgi:hypothetical protein